MIVAEAGSAHGGDLNQAFRLVDAAGEAGADCIKFQAIIADEIIHPLTGTVELPGGKVSLYQEFRQLERDEQFYARLKEYTEKRGMLFLCSAFGHDSARMLHSLGVEAFKIASPELNHYPLLRELTGYGLPIILSTGVSTWLDIERALDIAGDLSILLHCVTAYPAPEEQYNLKVIESLKQRFGRPTGISDHSRDPCLVPGLAVLSGACLVEKHITLDRSGHGLDDAIALDPEDFGRMVSTIRSFQSEPESEGLEWFTDKFGAERVRQVLGDGEKRLAPAEVMNYGRSNRSIHALIDLERGETLDPGKLCIVRSEKNLKPGLGPEFWQLLPGKALRKSVSAGQGIVWEDLEQERGELLQLVDRGGQPLGTAEREQCHGRPDRIHAVVHLYVLNPQGELYLQKRGAGKDFYPGRWDTSVGGHVHAGETVQTALEREALEELGIRVADAIYLGHYIYEDERETEFVWSFKATCSQSIHPNRAELETGRFFTLNEIDRQRRREQFTPNFWQGYKHFRRQL